jgi:uncharacterized protein (TIGR00725 family)
MSLSISVIGSAAGDKKLCDIAFLVGREIAARKAVLICGGLGGVMEAASKGAKSGGGLTIGILPGSDKKAANPYIDIPILTGMSEARNLIVALTADAVIAVGGELGTLSELAFAMKHKKPVIGLETWDLDKRYCSKVNIIPASTPKEAVEKAFKLIG